MSHAIEIPYAPGTMLWCRAAVSDKDYAPCPDCGGGKNVVLLTNAGMYEVPCETCAIGWDGPRGWVTVKEFRWVPALVELGQPEIRTGTATYPTRHGMFGPDELFADEAACAAYCARLEAEHRIAMEKQNWNKAKYGRTHAARYLNWHRQQLKRAEQDMAYHATKIRALTA